MVISTRRHWLAGVIRREGPGTEDESRSHREHGVGLKVYLASDRLLVESPYLTRQLSVSNDRQPCCGVTQSEDWLGFGIN
jgi:hypothetical protein